VNSFTTSTGSEATVTAGVDEVWTALTDPTLLARLTPFLHRVRPEGDHHWVWEMTKVPVLGRSYSFTFRERMTFDEPRRIDFTHDPAPGAREAAGVEGWYALGPMGEDTHLQTSLTITVELPLPALLRPAVTTAMKGAVALMGQRFSAHLLQHLHARSV
jgi:carbon monoxide dehydrogenase subunit G